MEPPDDLPTSVFNFAPWRWRWSDLFRLAFVIAVAIHFGWVAYLKLRFFYKNGF